MKSYDRFMKSYEWFMKSYEWLRSKDWPVGFWNQSQPTIVPQLPPDGWEQDDQELCLTWSKHNSLALNVSVGKTYTHSVGGGVRLVLPAKSLYCLVPNSRGYRYTKPSISYLDFHSVKSSAWHSQLLAWLMKKNHFKQANTICAGLAIWHGTVTNKKRLVSDLESLELKF